MKTRRSTIPKLLAALPCIAAAAVLAAHLKPKTPKLAQADTRSTVVSLPALLALSAEQLSQVPITRMNLLCAQCLSQQGDPDLDQCQATLETWARRVQAETERHFYRFRQNPAQFESSEGFFRMLMLSVVLAEDFGVQYNPQKKVLPASARTDDGFFSNPADVFLHGLLRPSSQPSTINPQPLAAPQSDGGGSTFNSPLGVQPSTCNLQPVTCNTPRLGTCSSLPVLHAAIGRQLGYPLKLVTTKGHLFLRWEGNGERFNIEATAHGLSRFDDDYYRHWPFEVSPAEETAEGYLKSLAPPEELAVFLSIRGMCLREAGRLPEAAQAFAAAVRLAPGCQGHRTMLAKLQTKLAQVPVGVGTALKGK